MILPRAMAFARPKVSEAWKRLKVTGRVKTIAGVKTNISQNKAQTKRSVKIVLIQVFQLKFGPVPALGDELRSFV